MLLAIADVVIVDEFALADAAWLRRGAERTREAVRKKHQIYGLPPPLEFAKGRHSWGRKKTRFLGDDY